MKILVTSCWHFDLVLGGYDMHGDIMRAMRSVADATHGVDLGIHLGDLFESRRPTPRAYAAVFSFLGQVGCPFVFIPGNHDVGALEPLESARFPFEVKVVNVPCAFNVLKRNFLFVGHLRDVDVVDKPRSAQVMVDDCFALAERWHDSVEGEWRVDAVFSHLDVEGAVFSSGTTSRGVSLSMPVSARSLPVPIFNGHIHRRQKLEPNIWMPGSLVRTDFGERDEGKGFLVAEI